MCARGGVLCNRDIRWVAAASHLSSVVGRRIQAFGPHRLRCVCSVVECGLHTECMPSSLENSRNRTDFVANSPCNALGGICQNVVGVRSHFFPEARVSDTYPSLHRELLSGFLSFRKPLDRDKSYQIICFKNPIWPIRFPALFQR